MKKSLLSQVDENRLCRGEKKCLIVFSAKNTSGVGDTEG